MSDATRILARIEAGDPVAAEELLPLVYGELRKLAAAQLAHEKPGQTLQPTALVHEAWLRLAKPGVGNRASEVGACGSRTQFLLAASQAMRRILIERARGKAALKRGGQRQRIDLECHDLAVAERSEELLALDATLKKLQTAEPRAAELVQLRFFGGCTMEEAAELLGVSLRSGQRLWAYAKAWLLEELERE